MSDQRPQGTVVPIAPAPRPIDPGYHHHLGFNTWKLRDGGPQPDGTHEAISISDPDGKDLERCWDRPCEAWPLDEGGHMQALFGDLDLDAPAAAG